MSLSILGLSASTEISDVCLEGKPAKNVRNACNLFMISIVSYFRVILNGWLMHGLHLLMKIKILNASILVNILRMELESLRNLRFIKGKGVVINKN